MKKVLFTSTIFGFAFICQAQQAKIAAAPVKFTPPVIVKDAVPVKVRKKDAVKFTPPVIKKNEPAPVRKTKKPEPVKFTPPVIVKD